MTEFFYMGGHGFFIWTSYGFCLLSLALAFVICLRQHKTLRRHIEHRQRFNTHTAS